MQRPRQAGSVGIQSMERREAIRGRLLVVGGAVVALGLLVGGCGYSEHDEYFHIRSIVVEPTPGDGSTIASLDRSGQAGNARAAMAMNRPRGQASDQPVARE